MRAYCSQKQYVHSWCIYCLKNSSKCTSWWKNFTIFLVWTLWEEGGSMDRDVALVEWNLGWCWAGSGIQLRSQIWEFLRSPRLHFTTLDCFLLPLPLWGPTYDPRGTNSVVDWNQTKTHLKLLCACWAHHKLLCLM